MRHGFVVESVSDGVLVAADGRSETFTLCVWATGAAAHGFARTLGAAGIPVTDRGWIRVKDTLQSVAHDAIFAAGDCAAVEGPDGPPPKAGVYAVRAGPVLSRNLPAVLTGGPLETYAPQRDFLKLLMTGDGSAIGFRFGRVLRGPWVRGGVRERELRADPRHPHRCQVWKLKDMIDRSFMDLFAPEALGHPPKRGPWGAPPAQYDAVDLPPRPEPEDAAALLERTDAGVDHQAAFAILKYMMADADYRAAVLARVP